MSIVQFPLLRKPDVGVRVTRDETTADLARRRFDDALHKFRQAQNPTTAQNLIRAVAITLSMKRYFGEETP